MEPNSAPPPGLGAAKAGGEAAAPAPAPPAADGGGRGAWFLVDNGGALAYRSAPHMDAKTTAIARPRELVFAAQQPPEHAGWIQTRESLWLPSQFLLPLTAVISAEEETEAHENHSRVAEEMRAKDQRGSGGGSWQPGFYRVDDGGGVAFRKSPSWEQEERTRVAARASELLFISEQSAENPDWMMTEEGLWIPARFLVPVAGGEVGEAELAQARRHHREVARTLGLGSEPRSPRRSLTGSPRASLSSLASPLAWHPFLHTAIL